MSYLNDPCLLVEAELRDQGAKQSGNEFEFRCPSTDHADDRPSASFNSVNGLWYCHGCGSKGNVYQLAELLGIQAVSVDTTINGFVYGDAEGNPSFRVVRKEPKGFFQQTPDGAGGWTSGLNGVAPVLFGLQELAAAQAETVLVVEGEKDVLTARTLGFVATTNPMGAGKWRDSYSEFLRNRDVVIVPDNDSAGLKHQEQVALSLSPVARRVRSMAVLPGVGEKGDLTDWVNEGGSRGGLLRLIEQAPDFASQRGSGSQFIQLSKVERKQVKWLMKDFIPRGSLTLLAGDPGVGKSFIAAALAAAVTTNIEPREVFLMSAEDSAGHVLRPRLDSMGADNDRVFINPEPRTLDDDGFHSLQEAVDTYHPALVVIDPFTAYVGASRDIYRANEVREFTARLTALAEQSGAAVVVVGHLNKGSGRKGIYRISGSIDWVASARTVILAGTSTTSDEERAICVVKSNYARTGIAVGYSIIEGKFQWLEKTELTVDDLLSEPTHSYDAPARAEAEQFLLNALVNGPLASTTLGDMAQQHGITIATLRRAKTQLGVVSIRDGKGGNDGTGQWLSQLPKNVRQLQGVHVDTDDHLALFQYETGLSRLQDEHLARGQSKLNISANNHVENSEHGI